MVATAFRDGTDDALDKAFEALRGMNDLELWVRLNAELNKAASAEAGVSSVAAALGSTVPPVSITAQLDDLAHQVQQSNAMKRADEAGGRLRRLAAINATLFHGVDDPEMTAPSEATTETSWPRRTFPLYLDTDAACQYCCASSIRLLLCDAA